MLTKCVVPPRESEYDEGELNSEAESPETSSEGFTSDGDDSNEVNKFETSVVLYSKRVVFSKSVLIFKGRSK